ncbi:MAG TPA: DUF4332 domain-containing protein [Pyrinomonadaceae bacterium]|nr:DUF4332 domain-containing protein [Pyrinomonadaceae bacterium]
MSILDSFKRKRVPSTQTENGETQLTSKASTLADDSGANHEDLASALGFAVDSLQTQLSQMSNPVSDFGLREVSLQAKVTMNITPLGVLTYRFISPGDKVDPQTINTLSLTIVPVPKQDPVGTLTRGDFQREIDVEKIPGIDKEIKARLQQQGIYTTSDFVQVGTRLRSAVKLAALLDVDRERLNEWLARAQLLMLDGMKSETANILFDAGIRSLVDLASLTPQQVIRRYEKQAATTRDPDQRLDETQVEQWIRTASIYTGTPDKSLAGPIPTAKSGVF